jgi:predicted enzyme related to lactoylglutathione lyase
VRDPVGAPLVLLRAAGGDPADADPPVGSWLWVDLWTDDAATAKAFYAELVGFEARDVEAGPEHVYHVLGRDGRARAGLVEVDMEGIEPNWLPWVRVANVGHTVKRVREQGGSVLLERKDLAILIDPTGAAIGVQRHGGIEARSGS